VQDTLADHGLQETSAPALPPIPRMPFR
jgi:hypothetical protein